MIHFIFRKIEKINIRLNFKDETFGGELPTAISADTKCDLDDLIKKTVMENVGFYSNFQIF